MRTPSGGARTGPTVRGGGQAKPMRWRLTMVGGRSTEPETCTTSRASILAGIQIQTFAFSCSAIQKPECHDRLACGECGEDASGYDPQADGLKVRSLSIRV